MKPRRIRPGGRWLLLLFLVWLAAPPWARAGEVELSNRAAISLEYDDNVYKTNRDRTLDELGRLFYDFGLHWAITPANLLLTNYQVGGKLYFHESDESAVINQLQLGYTNSSLPTVQMGVLGSVKLRNVADAQEDYLKWTGRAFAGKTFLQSLYTGVHAEYSEFDYRGSTWYDYWTQLYGAEARYDYERVFSVGLGYDYEIKTYPYKALKDIGASDIVLVEENDLRVDHLHEFSLSGRYQKTFFETLPFLANLTYTYQVNDSNSYGDSYNNHRVMLGLSQYIFQDTSVHFLGVFQFRNSAEKVLIPHSYSIEEDDENYNQIELRLTHGFNDYLSLFAGYHRYWSDSSFADLSFTKNLYALGLTVDF